MKQSNWSIFWGLAFPLAALILVVAPYFGPWASSLPDPIAIHWSLNAAPDGSMALATWSRFLAIAAAALSLALIAMMALESQHPRAAYRNAAVIVILFLSTTIGVAQGVYIENSGAESWRDAHLSLGGILLMVSPALGMSALAMRRFSQRWIAREPTDTLPTLGLGPGERAVWLQAVDSPLIIVIGVLVGVGMVMTAIVANDPLLWITTAVTLAVLALFAHVLVRIDATGLEVQYGPIGWPRTKIPLNRIDSARTEVIDPLAWGGWGYRGIMALTGRAAVILRYGPGIIVELDNGKEFCVTVDDAERGAGLLNDLVTHNRREQVEK